MIWLNGEFRSEGILIDSRDRGFLLGDGLFETVLVIADRPVLLDAHVDRLTRSAEAMGMAVPLTLDRFRDIIACLAYPALDGFQRRALRITLTRGVGGRGLDFDVDEKPPTLLMTLNDLPPRPAAWRYCLTDNIRPRGAFSSEHKTLNYLENVLAAHKAKQAGADEAILVNDAGRPVCGARSNLFVMTEDGRVVTPSLPDGALGGIVRAQTLSVAEKAGLYVQEKPIERDHLTDGFVFFTNSLNGIVRGAGETPCPGGFRDLLSAVNDRVLRP